MAEGKIYQAISDVMADIGAIGKNQKNLQQGFMFRGIDAVMNAINPALIKHKVFVVPEILEQSREERTTAKGALLIYSICKVKYTFYAEDGSSIIAVVVGEGMDSGDKATNKAMSIAFKYACFQVLCIPTEEMKDPDEECHGPEPKDKKPSKPAEKPKEEAKNSKSSKAKQSDKPEQDEADPNAKIDEIKLNVINGELARTGVKAAQITGMLKIEKLEDMTIKQFMMVMNKFKVTPDKKGA